MAYTNFIPTVWAEGIERELERLCVFAEDCNRKYEGKVKEKGESVKILGVGKPTIRELERSGASGDITGPEEVEDTSIFLPINKINYFNYMVGDIDKAQATNGIMAALQAETSEGLANKMDKYIASFAAKTEAIKAFAATKKVVSGTAGEGTINILEAIDEAIQMLQENDVSNSTKVVMTVTPRFYKLFRRDYASKDTDNSDILKNGYVGKYGNIFVKLSNNVAKSSNGAEDYIMVRTQRAIAFVNPMTHVEAYRPEKKFADAVKGFILYDGKIVRPKEMVILNVKYA